MPNYISVMDNDMDNVKGYNDILREEIIYELGEMSEQLDELKSSFEVLAGIDEAIDLGKFIRAKKFLTKSYRQINSALKKLREINLFAEAEVEYGINTIR